MDLKSFGCSFLFGTDLSDCQYDQQQLYPVPSQMTWPALLANKLGMDYKCHAHGGSGNLAIVDRLLNDIALRKDTCFYVVGWTYIDRFDFRDPNGGPTGTNDWSTVRPYGDDDVAQTYYKNLHSDYRDKLTSLLNIKTAIDTLRSRGHRFVMTSMDDLLMDSRFHISPGVEYLQNYVRDHVVTFDGMNFLDWSKHKGFAISKDNHPLEEAHACAADYMLDKITKE